MQNSELFGCNPHKVYSSITQSNNLARISGVVWNTFWGPTLGTNGPHHEFKLQTRKAGCQLGEKCGPGETTSPVPERGVLSLRIGITRSATGERVDSRGGGGVAAARTGLPENTSVSWEYDMSSACE